MSGIRWVVGISSLPLFGLVACVIISIYKDFAMVTSTHCRVPNLLPSISAAIGEFSPQTEIWRFCIAIHSPPRLLGPLIMVSHYQNYHPKSILFHPTVYLASLVNFVELLSLIMLSFVASVANYTVHKASFVSFVSASVVSMILQLVLRRWTWDFKSMPWPYNSYYRQQKYLFYCYLGSLMLTGIFFLRHNVRCEPYVYSLFALMEYTTVVVNVVLNCHFALDYVGGRESIFHNSRHV